MISELLYSIQAYTVCVYRQQHIYNFRGFSPIDFRSSYILQSMEIEIQTDVYIQMQQQLLSGHNRQISREVGKTTPDLSDESKRPESVKDRKNREKTAVYSKEKYIYMYTVYKYIYIHTHQMECSDVSIEVPTDDVVYKLCG